MLKDMHHPKRKVWILLFLLAVPAFSARFFPSQKEEALFRQQFQAAYTRVGQAYEKLIHLWNPKLKPEAVKEIAQAILFYTMYFNRNRKVPIDPRIVIAIIKVESNFKLKAVSHKGALGLGQLMPGTAASVGLKRSHVFHPIYNIYGTVRVLRGYFDRWSKLPYPQQYLFAIASYNAGPNAVARYGGIPPYSETIRYVQKVTRIYRQLAPEAFP